VVQPFQVVKVRMQAKEHLGRYHSSLDCALKMLRTEGVASFASSGAGATVMRNSIWNSIYFGLMAKTRELKARRLASSGGWRAGAAAIDTLTDLVAGFTCGVIATCFNAPFDVAKSRQQSQLPSGSLQASGRSAHAAAGAQGARYGSTLATLVRIAHEEGLSSCWRGFGPKAIRMGLAGLVGLKSFEVVQWLLGSASPVAEVRE